jgi:hypothetical protein
MLTRLLPCPAPSPVASRIDNSSQLGSLLLSQNYSGQRSVEESLCPLNKTRWERHWPHFVSVTSFSILSMFARPRMERTELAKICEQWEHFAKHFQIREKILDSSPTPAFKCQFKSWQIIYWGSGRKYLRLWGLYGLWCDKLTLSAIVSKEPARHNTEMNTRSSVPIKLYS